MRSDRSSNRRTEPSESAEAVLLGVIAACFIPIGLLVLAVHGGGLASVVVTFVVLVLITAALTRVITRLAGESGGTRS